MASVQTLYGSNACMSIGDVSRDENGVGEIRFVCACCAPSADWESWVAIRKSAVKHVGPLRIGTFPDFALWLWVLECARLLIP